MGLCLCMLTSYLCENTLIFVLNHIANLQLPVIIQLNRIGPGSSGSDENSFCHSPPLQAEGQVRLLLTDHVVVPAVLGLDASQVRIQVHGRELELALADLPVAFVRRDF